MSEQKEGLPGLGTLEATPKILDAMLAPAEDAVLDWKPAPERWSVGEVLAHLADVEREFRRRARSIVEEERPRLASYDQNARAATGAYRSKPGRERLAEFRREREESLRFLRGVKAASLARTAEHPELGEVTLSQLLHEWAFHDLGHVRQAAEVFRARAYWPGMGGWQRYYTIKP